MKNLFLILFISLIFFSCSKEENTFEAFSSEAFAYDLGDGWEVNATIRVKGLKLEESESGFSASVSCTVDLISPDGKKIEGISSATQEKTSKEKIKDLGVEVQFELDSTFTTGKYKLIYHLTDDYSGTSTTAEKEFEIM